MLNEYFASVFTDEKLEHFPVNIKNHEHITRNLLGLRKIISPKKGCPYCTILPQTEFLPTTLQAPLIEIVTSRH